MLFLNSKENKNLIENNYVIGGTSIYSKFLNSNYQHYIDKIYTTVINKDYNADCYFPKITKNFVAFDKKILSDDATLNIYQNKSNLKNNSHFDFKIFDSFFNLYKTFLFLKEINFHLIFMNI